MNFNETIKKLNDLIDYPHSDKKFVLSLYKTLFNKVNLSDSKNFKAIITISDKLIGHYLQRQDYDSVLNIYKIEHTFFYKQFEDEYSEKLSNVIKNAEISEDGLKNILDYLLVSFEVIINRWKNIVLQLEELNDKKVDKIIETQIKPLLYKSNFHIIHSIHFLKHNYSELQKVYDKINELSLIDPLTGLKNKRYFYMTYENLFYMANRMKITICFVMLDIDDFKKINDTYGHQKGDEVLLKIALIVSNFFRRSDMVIRYGGDEILIMLTDTTSYNVKSLIAQLLKRVSTTVFDSEQGKFFVTMSAGIACEKVENCYKPLNLKNKLLKKSDKAMYKSKEEGKNRVFIYEEI